MCCYKRSKHQKYWYALTPMGLLYPAEHWICCPDIHGFPSLLPDHIFQHTYNACSALVLSMVGSLIVEYMYSTTNNEVLTLYLQYQSSTSIFSLASQCYIVTIAAMVVTPRKLRVYCCPSARTPRSESSQITNDK